MNQWHASAAVSDGATLSLYLKNITAGVPNYMLVGTLNISSSTNSALTVGAGDGSAWDAGVITVGRGLYNGAHSDRLFGYIDDIRLSGAALNPNEFLYSTPPAPVAPTGLTALGADGQVSLSWSVVPNATAYKVKRAVASGGPYAVIGNPASPNLTDMGLGNGTAYYYVVAAEGLGGESPDSAEVLGRAMATLPPELSTTGDADYIQLTWPVTHTGWRLESQTNSLSVGLSPKWFTTLDSPATNQVFIPIQAINGSVYFRLVYP